MSRPVPTGWLAAVVLLASVMPGAASAQDVEEKDGCTVLCTRSRWPSPEGAAVTPETFTPIG